MNLKKVKRIVVFMAIGALSISMLGACSGSETRDASKGGSSNKGSGDLVMAWWGNQVRNEKTQEVLEKYKKEKNVTVKGQFYQWNDYWSKMATAAAGNSMPDLLQMDYSYIDQYVENGQLLDLTPYIKSGALDVSKIPDNVIRMGEVGEGNYGIAAGISGNCLFYKKEIWEKFVE